MKAEPGSRSEAGGLSGVANARGADEARERDRPRREYWMEASRAPAPESERSRRCRGAGYRRRERERDATRRTILREPSTRLPPGARSLPSLEDEEVNEPEKGTDGAVIPSTESVEDDKVNDH